MRGKELWMKKRIRRAAAAPAVFVAVIALAASAAFGPKAEAFGGFGGGKPPGWEDPAAHDGETVTGAELLELIKDPPDEVCIRVGTSLDSNGFWEIQKYGWDADSFYELQEQIDPEWEAEIVAGAEDPMNTSYIDPAATFTASAKSNPEGEVTTIEFLKDGAEGQANEGEEEGAQAEAEAAATTGNGGISALASGKFGPAATAWLAALMAAGLALAAVEVVSNWRILSKAGEPGWKVLVPFYGSYAYAKAVWMGEAFFVSLALGAASSASLGAASAAKGYAATALGFAGAAAYVACLLMQVFMLHATSKSFGHGALFTAGLVLLRPVFKLALAFGKDEYLGACGGYYDEDGDDD